MLVHHYLALGERIMDHTCTLRLISGVFSIHGLIRTFIHVMYLYTMTMMTLYLSCTEKKPTHQTHHRSYYFRTAS